MSRTLTGGATMAAVAILALMVVASPSSAAATFTASEQDSEGSTNTLALQGTFDNDFEFVGSAAIHAWGTGTLSSWSNDKFTDEAFVILGAKDPTTGTSKVIKFLAITSPCGDKLFLRLEGTAAANFDANYEYTITGGTGRFAGASGSGKQHVPPPTEFDGKKGKGPESIDGVIILP